MFSIPVALQAEAYSSDAYTRNLTQNELTLRHSTLISRGYGGHQSIDLRSKRKATDSRCRHSYSIDCACDRSKTRLTMLQVPQLSLR